MDGTLTGILGREAAARGRYLTMDELVKENKRLEVDLKGLGMNIQRRQSAHGGRGCGGKFLG